MIVFFARSYTNVYLLDEHKRINDTSAVEKKFHKKNESIILLLCEKYISVVLLFLLCFL